MDCPLPLETMRNEDEGVGFLSIILGGVAAWSQMEQQKKAAEAAKKAAKQAALQAAEQQSVLSRMTVGPTPWLLGGGVLATLAVLYFYMRK